MEPHPTASSQAETAAGEERLAERKGTHDQISNKEIDRDQRCDNRQCSAEVSRLESLLSEARDKCEKLESQRKSLMNRLAAKDSEIGELQQRLRDERCTAWLKSPKRVSYLEKEQLSKELKLKTRELESVTAELEEQRRLFAESVSKAVVAAERRETTRLKEECEHLKEQLNAANRALETLQNEKRTLVAQLAQAETKFGTASNVSFPGRVRGILLRSCLIVDCFFRFPETRT